MRSLRTNWVGKVELAETGQIASDETLPVAQGEIATEAGEQAFVVVGPGFAALFKLHDVMADLCQ